MNPKCVIVYGRMSLWTFVWDYGERAGVNYFSIVDKRLIYIRYYIIQRK